MDPVNEAERDRREPKLLYYKLLALRFSQLPSDQLPPYAYMVREMAKNPSLLEPNVDIHTYRAFVEANGNCCARPGDEALMVKSSERAASLRLRGNGCYQRKQYDAALKTYNESICAAPGDSEDLAIGYANRSAVFFAKEVYGVALVNIDLARKHNYPERLMPKLVDREFKCRRKLEEMADTEKRIPSATVDLVPNAKIPFLADGIRAVQDPKHGPIMVTERDFKAGDVILREKPVVACVSEETVFGSCNYCLSTNLLHLIPCPDCTWAMFCDEECLRKGRKLHRFECGICVALVRLNDFCMGAKLFFHGLSLFDDDITKMMQFCREVQGTESRFVELDYSNYDPVEEFRAFLTAKSRRPDQPMYDNILMFNSATYYGLYMRVPLVQSLITTDEQKDFMQQCFVDYQVLRRGFTILQTEYGHLYPIASYFGHSCDPNTIVVETGHELRMIAQRPIRRGGQIHFSYGPHCLQSPDTFDYLMHGTGFTCVCDFCDKDRRPEWLSKANQPDTIDPAAWAVVKKITSGSELTVADKMNAIQQFIQRYGSRHPQKDFAKMVRVYGESLKAAHIYEMNFAMERKIGASGK